MLPSTGIDKIDLLLNLSEAYLNTSTLKTHLIWRIMHWNYATAINDLSRQARSLFLIAEAKQSKENNISAFDFYFQSNKIFEQLSDKEGMANCANNIGRVYRFLG